MQWSGSFELAKKSRWRFTVTAQFVQNQGERCVRGFRRAVCMGRFGWNNLL